eukprot:11823683-Prorocentrum_lima.AAC.1
MVCEGPYVAGSGLATNIMEVGRVSEAGSCRPGGGKRMQGANLQSPAGKQPCCLRGGPEDRTVEEVREVLQRRVLRGLFQRDLARAHMEDLVP